MEPLAVIVFNNGYIMSFRVKNKEIASFFQSKKSRFSKDWKSFNQEIALNLVNEHHIFIEDMAYTIFLNLYIMAGEDKREDVRGFLFKIFNLIPGANPVWFIF